jgi:branched-chain amino acid transport system ATP-binding protein
VPVESIGQPGTVPFFDLGDAHVFYYVALVVAAFALYAVANLRDSRVGRAFAAIRGSEVAAASLGINVVRYKLLGFACAGALAGLAGAVTLTGTQTASPDQFNFMHSLNFLAIVVVGGLRSLGGAVASALLFALLIGELFVRSPKLADYLDIISGALLLMVLLFFRGGLGAVPERLSLLAARLGPHAERVRQALWPRRQRVAAIDDENATPPARGPVRLRIARIAAAARPVPTGITSRLRNLRRQSKPRPKAGRPIDVGRIAERLTSGRARHTAPLHLQTVEANGRNGEVDVTTLLREAQSQAEVAGEEGPDGRRLPVLLSADNITVRFGGLVAVNDASLQVGAGEIIGLIGPNGAGKTTLFNAILGLNSPTAGTVHLFGHDVTTWDVHQRAALGVGRTFQVLQLFGDLTVFDNLLVATHLHNRTGVFGGLFVTPGARRHEREARARVRSVLRLMDLAQVAHRKVAGLPFGVLRLVEVARTLVTGAQLVCFDEPASGLDSTETERLIEWFRFLREIGITLLVIEHDVSMVVRLCDHIYVLDQGRLLAAGTPARIQRDPAVIASYLGAPLEVA